VGRSAHKQVCCAGKANAMKLDLKVFSLTAGLLVGLGVFLMTWWLVAFEGSTGDMTFLGRLYKGYNISPIGSLIGFVWGFVNGVIGGGLFAWLHNKIDVVLHPGAHA